MLSAEAENAAIPAKVIVMIVFLIGQFCVSEMYSMLKYFSKLVKGSDKRSIGEVLP